MAKKTNVPEIRFAGFTDPWEQRKLGELFTESNERSSSEEILSVSVANGIYPASESDRDTNPGASIANYKVVHVGDIVYNSMRMWQGAVDSSKYDGIVSPAYVVARPAVELDSICFGYLLKRTDMLYKYLCDSQGNSKDTQTLRYDRFAEIVAKVPPTIDEQRAIADCLKGLDILITLHQRKYDKLCAVKKSMLDKMFPKPGETEPEIRFAGFTDPWEQRKFSELASLRRGLTYSPADIRPYGQGIRVLRSSNINEDEFTLSNEDVFVDETVVRIELVQEGEILITAANGSPRLVGKRAIIDGLTGKTVHGGFMLCAHAEQPDYVAALMGSRWYQHFLATGVAGGNGSIGNLDKAALEDEYAFVPSIKEQELIGALFSRLNDLITLHQRKLNLLKNTKKSLLDRMFV